MSQPPGAPVRRWSQQRQVEKFTSLTATGQPSRKISRHEATPPGGWTTPPDVNTLGHAPSGCG